MTYDVGRMAAQCCAGRSRSPAGPLARLCRARYPVDTKAPHRDAPHDHVTSMNPLLRIALAAASAAALAGCAIPAQTTRLVDGPEPVTVRLEPAVPAAGQSAELTVTSPGADSIVVASENGLDRYWGTSGVLRARLTSDFGDSIPTGRSCSVCRDSSRARVSTS